MKTETTKKQPFFTELSRFIHALKSAYPESADWEIKEIFKKVTGKRPIDFIMEDSLPTDTQLNEIDRMIQQRLAHHPIAHLLGECEFMGEIFQVNSHTFIPRPETELLVTEALSVAKDRFASIAQPFAVDLGTGSGCIPVSFVKHLPNWRVLAFDISQDAVECAQKNVNQHGLLPQISVVKQNYFDAQWLSAGRNLPQIILANPPYISWKDYESLPNEVKNEPYHALIGGDEGFEIPQEILKLSVGRLASNGVIVMEIGAGQSEILTAYAQTVGLKLLHTIQDEQQHNRILSFEVNHG